MKNKLWEFGTRQVVYAAIGAALYGVLSWVTNILALPAAGNIALRPAVVIPAFFGIAFGPIVGFLTGAVGNILGDFLSGWGFFWSWDVGNGLMGLVPGLMAGAVTSFKDRGTIVKAVIYSIIGVIVGMLFSSLMEIPISGIDMNTALVGYFTPAALSNAINVLVLVPIVMVAYDAIAARSGR
ncbi:MAG: ECF transporter S component [Anaerolineae bacterium]|nr:MAG: ECF transporter S component [Anaerolineae bacterium]